MEYQKKILKIQLNETTKISIIKLNPSFSPTFVDHHLLADINFNGHCLVNNVSIPKRVIYI